MHLTRRETLGVLATLGSATLLSSVGHTKEGDAAKPAAEGGLRVPLGQHEVVPLPFDPTKLKGLSEKLLVSHHEKNYAGAVKNLNRVELELAQLPKDSPAFVVGGLRERELTFTNSMILHELYFGNLGGDGVPGGAIQKALADSYDGFGRFEQQFRAAAASLSGGSGWVILDFNFHTQDLRTYWSGNHTQSVAYGAPLLVLDMYEHAYHMDYGAAADRYIEAFFSNLSWDQVNDRYARARQASKVLNRESA